MLDNIHPEEDFDMRNLNLLLMGLFAILKSFHIFVIFLNRLKE